MKIVSFKIVLALLILCQFSFVQIIKAQIWAPLSSGITTTNGSNHLGVFSMVADTALFAAGQFNIAGGNVAYNIAEWDGSNWSAVGGGIGTGIEDISSFVNSLIIYNGNLYAAGYFTKAGANDSAYNIAEWNNTDWVGLGKGIAPTVEDNLFRVICTTVFNGKLCVGGVFDTAGGMPAVNIAEWNGTTWSALGSGIGNLASFVNSLAVYNDTLYAAGFFQQAGADTVYNIAKWDGTNWKALGSGIGTGEGDDSSVVYSLTVYNGNLYAAGAFSTAGGTTAYNLAQWDGTAWSAVGQGIGAGAGDIYSYANTVAAINGNLYVGGYFNVAGGIAANSIAAWDGTNWSALGLGIGTGDSDTYSEVYPISEFAGNLCVGGRFYIAGGDSINNIAEYIPATGINEVSGSNGVSIYPNPNNGVLNIVIKNVVDRSQLQIYNLLGAKVYQAQITDNNTAVNLRNEAAGPYFYRVCTAEGNIIATGKFMIQ